MSLEPENEGQTATDTLDITSKLVKLIKPLTADERKRIIQAAFLILGDSAGAIFDPPKKPSSNGSNSANATSDHIKAKSWIAQNGLAQDDLDQAFHIQGEEASVIVASMPGATKKDQTINAYVLTGVAQMLLTGEPSFTDAAARGVCVASGCFTEKHHARYIKDRGNLFTGAKDKGWTLTSPGLTHAASLIKETGKIAG